MRSVQQFSSGINRSRLGLMLAAALLVAWLVYASLGVLVPFLAGLVLAYILLPLVSFIERLAPFRASRPGLARVLALLLIYIGLIAAVSVLLVSLLPAIAHQIGSFIDELPGLIEKSRGAFDQWVGQYRATVPADVQARIEEEINKGLLALGVLVQGALVRTISIVSQTFGLLIAIFSVPVWLFYVLKDQKSLVAGLYSFFPESIRPDVVEIVHRIDKVMAAYIRAQLILGLTVGVITWVALMLAGVEFALVLGIIAGITELIPVIGPILGAVPAILVVLATSPEKTLLVVLIFIGVQTAENNLLVPRIHGTAVHIHPAVIMVLLVIASNVAGVWGMIVAVPLAAVCREIYSYLYLRLGDRELSVSERV